jgi:hypothetical protein
MAVKDRKIRRLSRLGIIRLGYLEKRQRKDGSTYTYPKQADRFLLHDAPDIEAFYHDQGIDEVRELDVRLPFKDIESNFPSFYQVWAGGVMVCQGDGEYIQYATPHTVKVDAKGTHVRNAPGDTLVSNGVAQKNFSWNGTQFAQGEIVPCPGKAGGLYPHCAACRLSCLLKVMMADPDLFRMGYYQIATGSTRNHDTIMGTLETMPTNNVNKMPFKLRLVEEATTYQDQKTGMRKKGKRFFLQLEPDPTITRRLYARATEHMLDAPQEQAALPETTEGPEWEYDADSEWAEGDPPAPPPFAEVQATETPTEAVEPEKAPPTIELVPMPDGITSWDAFFCAAIDKLGFANVGAVKYAILSVFGNKWKAEAKIADAWVLLQEYQHAMEAE